MGRKRKDEGVPSTDTAEVLPPARFVAPLRRPADVTMERKRLYRAVINGRVPVDEAAKLNYILTGIRTDLEADQPPQIDQTPRSVCRHGRHPRRAVAALSCRKEEIDRLNSQFIEQPPAHIAGPPMLKALMTTSTTTRTAEPPQAA